MRNVKDVSGEEIKNTEKILVESFFDKNSRKKTKTPQNL